MSDSDPPKNARNEPDDEAPEDEADAPGTDAAPVASASPARRSRRRPVPSTNQAPAPGDEPEDDEDEDKQKASKPRPNYLFLIIASVVFLAMDLGSKEWAVKRLSCAPAVAGGPPCEPGLACDVAQNPPLCVPGNLRPAGFQTVIENYFHFDLATNKGGAWGLLGDQPDSIRLPFFFLISALAVVFIVSLYRKLEPHQAALKWALPLVLGGALGNLVDRVRHQHVIDFIDWFYITAQGKELLAAGEQTYVEVVSNRGGAQLSAHWPTFNIADVWIVAGVVLMVADMFTPKRRVRRRGARTAGVPATTAPASEEG